LLAVFFCIAAGPVMAGLAALVFGVVLHITIVWVMCPIRSLLMTFLKNSVLRYGYIGNNGSFPNSITNILWRIS
jgi:hypothetical protein